MEQTRLCSGANSTLLWSKLEFALGVIQDSDTFPQLLGFALFLISRTDAEDSKPCIKREPASPRIIGDADVPLMIQERHHPHARGRERPRRPARATCVSNFSPPTTPTDNIFYRLSTSYHTYLHTPTQPAVYIYTYHNTMLAPAFRQRETAHYVLYRRSSEPVRASPHWRALAREALF